MIVFLCFLTSGTFGCCCILFALFALLCPATKIRTFQVDARLIKPCSNKSEDDGDDDDGNGDDDDGNGDDEDVRRAFSF